MRCAKASADLVVVRIAADVVDHGRQIVAVITRFEGQSRFILGVDEARRTSGSKKLTARAL